mgnify:CR=1 FL=1
MEENREPLSAIAIEKKLQLLRNKHFSEDTIALVKSDYEYGLKEEEISLYLNKSYDIEQMKILSECLHKDVPKDVIDIIKNTKYSVHQMQVSLEFYEKGVPVQTIKEVMDKGEKPITMRRLYEEVLEQLNKVKKQIPEESEYVKALISQMDEVVAKINHQNERYDDCCFRWNPCQWNGTGNSGPQYLWSGGAYEFPCDRWNLFYGSRSFDRSGTSRRRH